MATGISPVLEKQWVMRALLLSFTMVRVFLWSFHGGCLSG